MSDQSKKSLIFLPGTYLKSLKSTCILKFRSTEMQYVMYPPTWFYYSFSQYITYVNILKINDIPIFLFSIATKYTFLGLHLLAQCTYVAMTGRYWNLYVIFIHTVDTEFMYWRWHMTHQHEACAMYRHIQCKNIHITQLP